MVDLAKPDRSALIVRHNKLIESRHSLTLTERRFMLWIVSQLSKHDDDFKIYRVTVADWVEFCGLKDKSAKHHFKELKVMADKLTTRNVFIDDNETDFQAYSWFSKISHKKGNGYIEVKLNPEIKPFLLQLKEQYTALTLEYAMLINSVYAGRIYDLLKQYQKIGERVIALDWLRERLGMEKKYSNFKDFRRRVLEVAQREINTKTDIAFDWQPIKEGRKVIAVHFKMRTNKPAVTLDSPEIKNPDTNRLFTRLCRHGVLEKAARDLVADYDAERINWHLRELESNLSAGKIKNAAAWLCEAIKKDYRQQKSLFDEEQKAASKKAANSRQQAAAIAQAVERIKEETEAENMRRVQAKIDSFTDDERAAFDANFLAEMNGGTDFDKTTAARFESKGLADMLAKVSYRIKARRDFPQILITAIELAKQQGENKAVIAALETEKASN